MKKLKKGDLLYQMDKDGFSLIRFISGDGRKVYFDAIEYDYNAKDFYIKDNTYNFMFSTNIFEYAELDKFSAYSMIFMVFKK